LNEEHPLPAGQVVDDFVREFERTAGGGQYEVDPSL
jgi:hypothetical protein